MLFCRNSNTYIYIHILCVSVFMSLSVTIDFSLLWVYYFMYIRNIEFMQYSRLYYLCRIIYVLTERTYNIL